MLFVERDKKESLDRLLKKLKGKVTSTKLLRKFRAMQAYKKPKEIRKEFNAKGAYKQRLILERD